MVEWKKNGEYPESKFGINFREDHSELAKLLSNEQGFYEPGKTVEVDGYIYTAKQVTSKKDNKQYIFVERVKSEHPPTQAAGTVQNVLVDRQSAIEKAHQENLKEDRERNFILQVIANHLHVLGIEVKNQNESLISVLKELREGQKFVQTGLDRIALALEFQNKRLANTE